MGSNFSIISADFLRKWVNFGTECARFSIKSAGVLKWVFENIRKYSKILQGGAHLIDLAPLAPKAQAAGDFGIISHRFHRLTLILFWSAWCSRQALFSKQALSQKLAFVHKAIKIAFLLS